ncbi:uncharacterized protein LOC108632750 [Ceratina calcarata]|uniref:Uncharacterized protein LOC108632750 n=1 Tax=Ceratina calcarata TaxID=156304 RepID=A0AAJ7JHK0_9HYME|nr:uncharacterized protein LOC108632750 [Ceratina calcarata]
MSLQSIVKAMKLGLISLSPDEILCYKEFNVEPYALEFEEMWSKKFSEKLILNLTPVGLNVSECWNIIVHGVFLQSPYIIRHLTLSGVDVSGIINWQTKISVASTKVIEFLTLIGIDEEVIALVEQHGIDEETEQMLVDLGLNEMDERLSTVEEIICECSLTILEPICGADILKTVCRTSSKTDSSIDSIGILDDLHGYSCRCHALEELKTDEEINARRNDYLRQNIMIPLSWAMARTLKYRPSDPIHFISYQLLSWVHGNVPENRKEDLRQLIALSTIAMDKKLVARNLLEEEERIRKKNLEALKNIPCEVCKEHQALRRVKEQCWKCVKKRVKKFGVCEFPDVCSSCKINVSNKSDV